MRVLYVVKTSDGAQWAADQAARLVRFGVDVHVALPRGKGRTVKAWTDGGAKVHITPTALPAYQPWRMAGVLRGMRELISHVQPDIIHSHFFDSTMILRMALGKDHRIPRIFQVPGPLHLENRLFKSVELGAAGSADHWIASSRCIMGHYRDAGVAQDRLFLSYYGFDTRNWRAERTGELRRLCRIGDEAKVVGNANFIYPPKWYLGQTRGLKAHEDVIDALGMVIRQRPDVVGVLIGGTFAGPGWYERSIRARAERVGRGRILMPGYQPAESIRRMWPDVDVAVHVPTSENCGGVTEPMAAGVPTIAGRIGGLPEQVVSGATGTLVSVRDPEGLARAVIEVLDNEERSKRMAMAGRDLTHRMFDVERTAREVFEIYQHILDRQKPRPEEFDSMAELDRVAS